jgi:hypothetical protein
MTQPGPDDQSPAQPGHPAGWPASPQWASPQWTNPQWTNPPSAQPAESTRAVQLPPVPPPGAPAGTPQPQPQSQGAWAPPGQPGQPQGAWAPPGQPGQPYAQWAPGQPPAPGATRGRKKWPAIVGGVVVLAALGTGGVLLANGGEPAVGDCITTSGDSFETVDCDASGAQYEIIGKEDQQITYDDFLADPTTCAEVGGAVYAAWYGADGKKGTVYCAGPIAGS